VKSELILAAVAEAATGLALLIASTLVGKLLLGEQLTGAALPVARVAGIADGGAVIHRQCQIDPGFNVLRLLQRVQLLGILLRQIGRFRTVLINVV
jgi:hypothetical protein